MNDVHGRNILVHEAISAICPIDGVQFPSDDPATWSFRPKPEATPAQIAEAQEMIGRFNVDTIATGLARSHRRELAAKLISGNDPILKLLSLAFKKIHAKLDAMEKRGGQPTRTFAEWQAEILDEFVNG